MYELDFMRKLKGKVAYLTLLEYDGFDYKEISGDGYERLPVIFNDIYFDVTDGINEGWFSKVQLSFNMSKSDWGRVDAMGVCEDKLSKNGYIKNFSNPIYIEKDTQLSFLEGDIKIIYPKIKTFY